MALQLAPGVSFCRTGGAIVFLDLRTDRYFRLAPRDQARFERFLGGEAADDELAAFVGAGLLAKGESDTPCAPASATLASHDIQGLAPARASLRGAIETGWHVMRARRAIDKTRLAGTIAALSHRKQTMSRMCEGAAISAALRFDANRSLIPVDRRCLIDSIALMRLLLSRALTAELVFGVRIDPFAAHCWLQADDHILTCAHDEARGFTPILIL